MEWQNRDFHARILGNRIQRGRVSRRSRLRKGYAFASSNEGWNRSTIKDHPEDSYYESRQREWMLEGFPELYDGGIAPAVSTSWTDHDSVRGM
jgi:hypothetical protein